MNDITQSDLLAAREGRVAYPIIETSLYGKAALIAEKNGVKILLTSDKKYAILHGTKTAQPSPHTGTDRYTSATWALNAYHRVQEHKV